MTKNETDENKLKDHFAGLAMAAFISGYHANGEPQGHWPYKSIANEAYDVAEAMMEERRKRNEQN